MQKTLTSENPDMSGRHTHGYQTSTMAAIPQEAARQMPRTRKAAGRVISPLSLLRLSAGLPRSWQMCGRFVYSGAHIYYEENKLTNKLPLDVC